MTRAIRNGYLAVFLLVACRGDSKESSRLAPATPHGVAERIEIANSPSGLRELEYRDSATGDRYRMRASLGGEAKADSGWIESRETADGAESVRIEWTSTSVRVTANYGDGTSEFWFAGRSGGLERIDPDTVKQDDAAIAALPFALRSATQADVLLGEPTVATPVAVARMLVSQQPPAAPGTAQAALTLPCDNSIPITDNCGVEARMTKANQDVFSVPAGFFQDRNTMSLQCGDSDGLVRVQACPLSAYDCNTYRNAKTETPVSASAASDDTSNSNNACTILRSEREGVDVGKKFTVTGLAEIRPGRAVRPKDPGDEAKHPSGCKLYWDFPEDTDDVYHSQWNDGHTKVQDLRSFEVALTSGDATGTLAVGGKSQIQANVHTCQDSDNGDDEYAIHVRGTRTNELYTCSDTPPPSSTNCSGNSCGVVFVHGTSDHTQTTARDNYWTQDTVDKIRNGKPYVVVGYPGSSQPAYDSRSWGAVIDQIHEWLTANASITDYVVVTHSNGVNPVRYALMHPTANTPGGRRVDTVTNKMRKLIAAGASMQGTPLANSVTDAGGLGQIANWVSANLFSNDWNTPAVLQQRTERMGTCGNGQPFPSGTCSGYNGDGTFGSPTDCYRTGTTCGGKPVSTVVGTNVFAAVWSSDAWCGGYPATAALKATQCYGFGCSGCSDGFIGCASQSYLGTKIREDDRLNHNQSRRDCRGFPTIVKNEITNTGWSSGPPADYTIPPEQQACRTNYRGTLDQGYASITFEGCPVSFRDDGTVHHDCYLAYGADEAAHAVDTTPADGTLDGFASTALATTANYRAAATTGVTSGSCGPYSAPSRVSSTGCSSTWRGDGWCDQCLVGKLGYDIKQGTATGADDCVPASTNKCFDVVWNGASSQNEYGSYVECR